MSRKKPIKWLITTRPELREPGPGLPGSYVGPNGKPADKSHAAAFSTREAAKEFADRHGIKVDGSMVRIVMK